MLGVRTEEVVLFCSVASKAKHAAKEERSCMHACAVPAENSKRKWGQALTWRDNLALTPCSGWLSPLPAGWAADARSPSSSLSLCIFTVGAFFFSAPP